MKYKKNADPVRKKKKRRHSRDNSISLEQFERLLNVCEKSSDPLGNKFLVIPMVVGGFREAEIAHMKLSWIDFERKEIHVPAYDPCDCNSCCRAWKQKFGKSNKIFSKENVKKTQWEPKTPAGVRTVYFEFNPLFENIIFEYFKKYPRCPLSVSAIYKRIRALGKLAEIPKLHPHALRSTSASFLAGDGLQHDHLKKLMGWDSDEMAKMYINKANIKPREQLEKIYGKRSNLPTDMSYRVFCLTTIGKKLILRKHRPNEEKWLRDLLSKDQEAQRKLDIRWGYVP